MRVFLIRLPIAYSASNASTVFNPGGYISSKFYNEWLIRYPPLGLLYSASALKQQGHTVKIMDAELSGLNLAQILNIASKFCPDAICVSVNIFNPEFEFATLATMKKHLRCIVIARGHFPRLYPKETILNSEIDFALTGKGLYSISHLLEAIEKKSPLRQVCGIIYREKNGNIIKTSPEPPINLDSLPFPARELINNKIYTTALTVSNNFTTMTASIGCPYSCTYCADKNISYNSRKVENVIAEIEECRNKFNIEEITFLDSTFTIDRAKTIKLCNEILNRKIRFKWTIRTRADLVDAELLDYLAKAGCISVHYGIESGNQNILTKLGRKITLSQIRKALKLTSDKGLLCLGFFMLGNEGETTETIKDTLAFAKSLNLHCAQFNMAFPIPSTKIFEVSKEKLKLDLWLQSYKGKRIPLEMWKPQNTTLSWQQLNRWIKTAYLSFYLRPKQIRRLLCFRYIFAIILRQFRILLLLLGQQVKSIYYRKL